MAQRLLLHICCAPDACVPWPELIGEGYETTGFFYGGNIQPVEEYEKRKAALVTLMNSVGAGAAIPPYSTDEWMEAASSLADEPEGGGRCEVCFSVQLEAAAKYAEKNGFDCLTTTLTISPHKNVELINRIGGATAARHGLEWLSRVWRKNDGFRRSVLESRRLGLYRQNYCGCVYSIRTGNAEVAHIAE